MRDIKERLRDWCASVRRKPSPISDAVPMVQKAADRIEHLERVLRLAKDALECATMHHTTTSLPLKIERFGSVDAAHDFGRHTWRENIPGAIAAIDEALKS